MYGKIYCIVVTRSLIQLMLSFAAAYFLCEVVFQCCPVKGAFFYLPLSVGVCLLISGEICACVCSACVFSCVHTYLLYVRVCACGQLVEDSALPW